MVGFRVMTETNTPDGSLFSDRQFLAVWTVGILVSVVRWLEFLAVGIFAYDVTDSAFLVALLALLRFLPLALFGSLLGALGDMMDSARLLRITMAVACLASLGMTALFAMGIADYWHVAVSVFLSGIFWASDQPLRRKLIGEIAGLERIGRAMATDTATSNGSRLIGPLLGGAVYQWIGGVGIFAIAAGLYALALFLMMSVRRSKEAPAVADFDPLAPFTGAWQAIRYASRNREVLCILGVTVVFNIWGFPMLSMVPVIGKEELALSPSLVGMISALEGGSALIGALTIARFVQPSFYRKIYFSGVCALLAIIFTMGQFPGLTTLVLGLIGAGFAGACFSTMQSTLTYLASPSEMRGRLLGLITICIGSGLIGFANIGLMAEWFGASTALSIVAIEGAVPMVLIGLIWRELRSPHPPNAATGT